MTIIYNVGAYDDYSYEAISPVALGYLQIASGRLAKYQAINFLLLSRCLECYLQITNQLLREHTFQDGTFSTLSTSFIGALNSDRMVRSSVQWKYKMTNVWLTLVDELSRDFANIEVPDFKPKCTEVDPMIQAWANDFSMLSLDEDKVWLWRGWSSTNRNGQVSLMPLYPVYRRLGRKFTDRFFEVLDQYYRARKSNRVPCLRELTRFIAQYPGTLSANDFQQPEFVGQFWREFFVFFVKTSYGKTDGQSIFSIITLWRNQFLYFIQDHLIPSQLFAEPWGELPSPEPRYVRGSRTNIKKTSQGFEVKTKLLTHVPLHVSDEEAINLLFRQIEQDLQQIIGWAEWACSMTWQRHQRRISLASLGTPRIIREVGTNSGGHIWLTNPINPDYLKNISATFAHHGFLTREDMGINMLYHYPLSVTAEGLALPTTDALLPHCVLLVAEHPAITPSFLEKLELFDKNGKQTGFIVADGGNQLIGFKHRRGPQLAQQIIFLTARTTEIVKQILAHTEPLREYLRARGDDQWRYLLLTCKQGFGYPSRVKSLSTSTSQPERRAKLVDGLGHTSSLSFDERVELVDRLSLQTVRASAGTLVYLKTRSVEKMALALGHASYNPKLLERYLPKPILDFFQERWVRLFQNGFIVEALKESPYLLEASDFSSIEELHQFLSQHALRLIPQQLLPPQEDASESSNEQPTHHNEVVFGVNSGILTALISLQLTVESTTKPVDARASYWAEISRGLINHIESTLSDRPDLQSCLLIARNHAHPFNLKGLLHDE